MSTPPFKVKAVYEYTSQHDDDLHFSNGQIITVTEEEDDDWYSGEYEDDSGSLQQGIFPKNFVEKYEPIAPPRPTRTIRPTKETEISQGTTLVLPPSVAEPKLADTNIPTFKQPQSTLDNEHPQSTLSTSAGISEALQPAKVSRPTPVSKVFSLEPLNSNGSEKPIGNSFKDRIAAFNKPASPVTPFKPGKLSSSFIKKPFVAPPPSKNAYVPILRDQPTPKFYRRDDDYDVTAKECENHQQVDSAVLTPTFNTAVEDEPKPTSLKERIALLQKQQIEQASRLADISHKKERTKRPVMKHIDSNIQVEGNEGGDSVSLERINTDEITGKVSLDCVRDEQNLDRKHIQVIHGDFIGPEKQEEVAAQLSTQHTKGSDFAERESIVETELVEDNSDEDEEIDPEVKRKEELRARMAKMSGGMGMHGIFGPPGGISMPIVVAPKKKGNLSDKSFDEYKTDDSRTATLPAIPAPSKSQESARDLVTPEERAVEVVDPNHEFPSPQVMTHERDAPPIPGGRPAVPIQKDPLTLSGAQKYSGTGSESDDENSSRTECQTSVESVVHNHYHQLHEQEGSGSPISVHSNRESNPGLDPSSPISPINPIANKRASRPPPPIPSGFVSPKLQARAPPPPPPGINNLASTNELKSQLTYLPPINTSEESDEVMEYEGDHDTDITPLGRKDSPKNNTRTVSTENHNFTPSPTLLPSSEPPPIPSPVNSRVLAPVPLQLISDIRPSVIMPKSAPPPPPSGTWGHDDEYDPYKYVASKQRTPSIPSAVAITPNLESIEGDLYSASPPGSPYILHERKPQLPSRDFAGPPGNRAPPRTSLDVSRSAAVSRRSIDLSRISLDSGFLANDVDLAPKSFWWIQPNGIPPVFQGRKDIMFECEETSLSKNGKVMTTKELYILFLDYSQTIISVCFDPQNPADVKLEQRHEQPPSRLRQDQLEQAHEQLGRLIYNGVIARKETVVGDGTPQGLVTELLRPLSDVLLPIGTRSYGALVYGNIANASTQQNDEIRLGDLITFRNAKFQGKHGPLNAKYSMEVGKPDHVGIVAEWDGTKKKIKAWEQGRESKKVKLESFKLDDLRSGEVKIWRIMPRSWVGWEGQN